MKVHNPLSVSLALLATVILAFLVFFPGGLSLLMSRGVCSNEDEALIPTLRSHELIKTRPEGASVKEGLYSGCDRDDGYVYAGITYNSPDPLSEILSFYGNAAKKSGWQVVNSSGEEPCFSKPLGDAKAYMAIWIINDSEQKNNNTNFGVYISASHDPSSGEVMCY